MDNKLAEMAATQRQIGDKVTAELQAAIDRNCKKSAEETRHVLDRLRSDILDAVVGDTADLIAALALNENVWVMPRDDSRSVFAFYIGL